VLFHCAPIDIHAVPGSFGSDRGPINNLDFVGDKPIKREGVDLEIASVGGGGHQVDRYVVRAVRSQRKIMRFRKRRRSYGK
jgi:hypothetical protein